MDENQRLVFMYSQITCANIEMAAMQVEDKYYVLEGGYPVHSRQDYLALIEKYGIGHNSVIEYIR